MVNDFNGLISKLKSNSIKRIAVAVAQDKEVLEAIMIAKSRGIADAILVGDKFKITDIAKEIDMDLTEIKIIHEKNIEKATLLAVQLVATGKADMLMKGFVETATFLKAILNKDFGLKKESLISHVAIFEVEGIDRLLFITDAAFNMCPSIKEKVQIINNAVMVANICGINMPKVAPICAIEMVNPDMPSTIDAATLSIMNTRGQIKRCIIDGPLALDNAISEEAAIHKGIDGPVAGHADILLFHNIESANVMYKSLTYIANTISGGVLVGTSAPVILTSRADSCDTKVNSIAIAALVAEANSN